jgi:hypothetical protein
MMKKIRFAFILGGLLLAGAPACNKSDSGSILDFFIPNLSNNWKDLGRPGFELFFLPEQTGNESKFNGNENDPGNGQQYQFNGFYKNTYIEFTYTSGPNNGKKFTGAFDKNSNPLRMTVKNGSTTLLLERQP